MKKNINTVNKKGADKPEVSFIEQNSQECKIRE